MKRPAAILFVLAGALPVVATAPPQQNLAKGFAVDKSYHLENLGSISTFNGNLGVTLPLGLRYPVSSALSYQLVLTYGGNVWDFQVRPAYVVDNTATNGQREVWVEHATLGPLASTSTGGTVVRKFNAGMGWNVTLGYIEKGDTTDPYISPDGARHTFHATLDGTTPAVTGVFYTRDGSYLRKTTEEGYTQVEFPDGTRHRFDAVTGRLRYMLDRFGNQVEVQYAAGANCAADPADCAEDWTITDGFRTHKVDLKRMTGGAGDDAYSFDVVKTITFSHGTGSAAPYTFEYAPDGGTDALLPLPRPVAPMRQDCTVARYVLAAILHAVKLPDGSKFEISTDRGNAATVTDPSAIEFASMATDRADWTTDQTGCSSNTIQVWDQASASGHLQKIKRPTGATTEWTYQLYKFPAYDEPGSSCAGVVGQRDITTCDFSIASREVVGVKERSDTARDSTVLAKTTYGQEDTGTPTTKKTIVKTYDGATVVSTSEHYYFTPYTEVDTQRHAYGLPYTNLNTTTVRPAHEPANPDADGRFLSTKTCTGTCADGKLASYTFVKYDSDPSNEFSDPTSVNRRVVSERTVHLDDSGAITNEVIRDYSDWDNRGHFRTERTTTGRNSAPAIDRTVTTSYNQADAQTGALNASSDAWIVNTYSSQVVSETSGGQRKSQKSLFLFDRSTGFLTRRRTLKTIHVDTPSTTPAAVPTLANDLVVTYGQTSGNVTSEAYFGGDRQVLGYGSLASMSLSSAEYTVNHTYSSGALATTQYSGVTFKSADRTILQATGLPETSRDASGVETNYEYDLMGRLTFSSPAGSAATTYVFSTPATGASTVTIRQRNGSSKTSSVMTTAVVTYDDLGRVWREQRDMPATTSDSIRETLYNGRGLVASVSEWGSEDVSAHLARKTTFTYDGLGRLLQAKTPDGKITSSAYTGQRTVARKSSIATSTTGSESESTTTETTDDLGRLFEVTEPNATKTAYTYDVGGKLASVTVNAAARQAPRTFVYDGRGFLISENHPESGTTTYEYDSRGHVTKRTSGGSELSFSYDTAERLVQVNEGSLEVKAFTFDRPNSAAGTTNEDWSLGKLATATRHNRGTPSGDLTVTETYYYKNTAGRLSGKDTTLSTGEKFSESYSYNRLGAPTTINYPKCVADCAGGFEGPARSVSNVYANGLLTEVDTYATLGYAPNGMVTSVNHEKVDGAAATDTYAVDPDTGMGRPASITFTGFCNNLSVNTISNISATADTTSQIPVSAAGATSYQLFKTTSTTPVAETTSSPISVTVSGTAQYFVRVGNGDCTVDSNTFTISANTCAEPPSTITVSPSVVPRNGTARASVTETSGATYQWTVQGGEITSSAPYGAAIDFKADCDAAQVTISVKVIASCDAESLLTQKNVATGPATTATLSVSGSSTIAQGESKTINVALTGTAPWTLSWSPGAPSCNATAASFTCTATPAATTTYVLEATDSKGCTAQSQPLTLTVVPPAPFNLVATAATATSVQLMWSFAGTADKFEIQRRAAGGSFVADGTVLTVGALRTATANAAYLYRVRAVKANVPSAWSNVDLATTVIFTDDPAAALGVVQAQHIMELRTAANAVRALWSSSLASFAFTDPSLTGVEAKIAHVQEIRDTLNEARTGLVLGALSFTDPLLPGVLMQALHVNELRDGVR